jgi:hypothetical protein
LQLPVIELPAKRLGIDLAPCTLDVVHDSLQPSQLPDQVREHAFATSTQLNKLQASSGVGSNRPDLTHGPERSCIDAHEQFSSRAASNRQSGIDAAAAEAQVANLPRKNDSL